MPGDRRTSLLFSQFRVRRYMRANLKALSLASDTLLLFITQNVALYVVTVQLVGAKTALLGRITGWVGLGAVRHSWRYTVPQNRVNREHSVISRAISSSLYRANCCFEFVIFSFSSRHRYSLIYCAVFGEYEIFHIFFDT